MLINISENEYYQKFPSDPHLFISREFVNLNKSKTEQIFRLVEEHSSPSLGLVTGLKDGYLLSPFSAPFGGFHFSHELVYVSVINEFIQNLKCFIKSNSLKGIQITLPPNIYSETINAKLINCLYNNGLKIMTLDITNWVDLKSYNQKFNIGNSRTYLNQAINHGLMFKLTTQTKEKLEAYDVIKMNRTRLERPLYMSFDDLQKTNKICEIDYFTVEYINNETVAAAIFYRADPTIVYGLFLGDTEMGRKLRAMDFCTYNLWNHYKQYGYKYIDFGISSEEGIPNEGLLRFKETHEATSSLRYTFTWVNEM